MLRETALIATDRRILYAWTREPFDAPRGVVAHVHGMGEHSRRYDRLAIWWQTHGYAVAGFDQRGHGRSEGQRGHTASYDQLMDDVAAFLEVIEDHWSDLPITLYGHGMGGNIVLNYALRRRPPSVAIVASAPYLRFASEPQAWKLHGARLLRYLNPTFTRPTGLDVAALSRDPALIDAFRDDPLVHDRISMMFLTELVAAARFAISMAARTTHPTLVMHGDADRIAGLQGSADYVAAAGRRATLKVWQGFYHELHHEPAWTDVAAFVLAWMNQQMSGPA